MLSDHEINEMINEYGGILLDSPGLQTEKRFVQHGVTSTFDHSISVAKTAIRLSDKLGLQDKVDYNSLIKAALLHDYFLYDWHNDEPWHRLHGLTHGHTSLLNARRDFKDELNPRIEDSVEKHMFPLTKTPPSYIEGWLVTTADKSCAWLETFDSNRLHKRRILENRVLDGLPLVESAIKPIAGCLIDERIRKQRPADTALLRRGFYKGVAYMREASHRVYK